MVEDWTTVAIRKALLHKINKFLKTKDAKEHGFETAAGFVDDAIKDMISKYELKRFEHFNYHDDIIRVLDNSIGVRGDIIELRKKNNQLACGYCELTDCVHIKFVWSDPILVTDLKKAGIKSPF